MILILLALITIVVVSAYCSQKDVWVSWFHELICPIFCMVGLMCLVVYSIVGWFYIASDYKKDIINREYGTNYTQAEVFYGRDVINTIRQIDRKRIELNGNLLQEKESGSN